MTKMKTTKRALFASILSLLLCASMLVGSTFAWFTDTATTGVNTIQAGNLDIALEMATAWDAQGNPTAWDSAEGKTLDFRKAAGAPADEKILWEPGCTYQLPELRIVNKGDLTLKYMISITGIDGDAELNEAIEWTYGAYTVGTDYVTLAPNTASEVLTIKGHMKETAGNEFQSLSIEGISITVFATQVEAEYDSFGNQYDAAAPYLEDKDGNILIGDVGALLYFAKQVNVDKMDFSNKTVLLTNDIDMAGFNWTPIGQTGNNEFHGTFDGKGYTIRNLKIDTTSLSGQAAAAGLFGWVSDYSSDVPTVIKNVKIDGATVNSGKHAGAVVGYATGSVTIEGCEVKNATIQGTRVGAVVGYQDTTVVIKNCVADTATLTGTDSVSEVVGYQQSPALVTGCTATNVKLIVAGDEAFENAIKDKRANITLAAGNYTMRNTDFDVTITGSKDAVLKLDKGVTGNSNTITFEGITIEGHYNDANKNDWYTEQLKGATKAIYKNCTIKHLITGYVSSDFIGCVFENTFTDQYSVYCYTNGTFNFTDCIFNTANSKAIKIFDENNGGAGDKTVNVTNCTFVAAKTNKAAIEINSANRTDSNKYIVNISNCTVNENYTKLWADEGTKSEVYINGKKWYAPVTDASNVADALEQQDNVTVDVGNDVVISNDTVTVPEGKELTIESGKIDASSNYGIAISAGKDTTVTLNDGTYAAYEMAQVIDAQSTGAEVIANGGIYEGNYLAFVRADAKVTVTGGTFATAENPGEVLVVCDDDNNTAVVNITGGTFYAGALCNNAVKTNITGGTFYLDALTDYASLSEYLGDYITITGGTFNIDPSDWVAAGYTAVNNNGSWTVQAQ